MAGYCTIRGEQLWYDRRMEGLSDAAFRLLMFCFSGPGRTSLGLRRFRLADMMAHVAGWDEGTAQAALAELEQAGLVAYDSGRQLLFLTMQFEHSPIVGSGLKTLQGAVKALLEMPDSRVLFPVLKHLEQAAESLARADERGKTAGALVSLKGHLALKRKAVMAGCPIGGASGVATGAETTPDGASDGCGSQSQDVVVASGGPQDRCPIDGASGVGTGGGTTPDGASGFGKFGLPEPEPEPEQDPPLNPPRQRGSPIDRGGGGARGQGRGSRRGRGESRQESRYAKFDR